MEGVDGRVVMWGGYYRGRVVGGLEWKGKEVKKGWVLERKKGGCEKYGGEGKDKVGVGDIDEEGWDEMVYGCCRLEEDGKGVYWRGMGEGDGMEVSEFDGG